ncbi:MAG: transcriptional regulator [Rhodospirillaceae bacterium]|nr:transcriptional regulator [Rhodospirillaceae bacterium]|tara:strand:- start:2058 stop:2657 length:600 start_codon:yes stop_codon:yes gene_type:complete
MTARNPLVENLINAHKAVVQTLPDTATKSFLSKCHAALSKPGKTTTRDIANCPPVCAHIEESLKIAAQASTEMGHLANAFEAISKILPWQPRTDYVDQGNDFYEGHANAVIVGQKGIENHDSVRMGVSLIAPKIEYPNHRHPPEEGYLVISKGEWRQGTGEWFSRKSGDTVHNSPNIWHAMKAGDQPLLAIWMLWMKSS